MHDLYIDIETFSAAPIQKTGSYRYADDDTFEILLCGFSLDGGPVRVLDLVTSEEDRAFYDDVFLKWLVDPDYAKYAHNAPFEMGCFLKVLSERGMLNGLAQKQ